MARTAGKHKKAVRAKREVRSPAQLPLRKKLFEGQELPGQHTGQRQRVAGRTGDVLLTRTKGPAGTAQRHETVLQSLGLRKVGQSRVVSSEDAARWGEVNKVRPFLDIVPLAKPAGKTVSTTDVETLRVNARYDDIATDFTRGSIVTLTDGEYLQLNGVFADDSETRAATAHWSSAAPIAELLGRIVTAVGTPAEDAYEGMVIEEPPNEPFETGTGKSSDVLAYVLNEATMVTYVSIDFGSFQYTWRAPFRRSSLNQAKLAESTASAEKLDRQLLARVIGETATPGIAINVDAYLSSLSVNAE
jgi:ribosomal protein L30/L7E